MNKLWADRNLEERRILNPAFLGLLLWSGARGFASVKDEGMPYGFAFLLLPIVLHKQTRESLPSNTRTTVLTWRIENPRSVVGFDGRAAALVPAVKEAIIFGTRGKLMLLERARLVAQPRPRATAKFLKEASLEVASCVKKAEFVGKWFAGSGEIGTVMALWGVAP